MHTLSDQCATGGRSHLQRRILWDPDPGTLSTSCLASKSTSRLIAHSVGVLVLLLFSECRPLS